MIIYFAGNLPLRESSQLNLNIKGYLVIMN